MEQSIKASVTFFLIRSQFQPTAGTMAIKPLLISPKSPFPHLLRLNTRRDFSGNNPADTHETERLPRAAAEATVFQ